jgi:hypothetical protein
MESRIDAYLAIAAGPAAAGPIADLGSEGERAGNGPVRQIATDQATSGSLVATAPLARTGRVPSPTQAIPSAKVEPVVAPAGGEYMGGAVLRPGGEGKP